MIKTIKSTSIIKEKDFIFLFTLLIISLTVNLFLWWQYQKQRAALISRSNIRQAKSGEVIQSISGSNLAGNNEIITFSESDKPTVLYIFTPSCSWCNKNLESINTLIKLRGSSYRFIGLSLSKEDLQAYVSKNNISFPVYVDLSQENIQTLGLGYTPQTIIINPDGKLIKNWVGAYGDTIKSELETYFNIRLPGIIDDDISESKKSCAYCTHSGFIYSPGALLAQGKVRLRCEMTGRWSTIFLSSHL